MTSSTPAGRSLLATNSSYLKSARTDVSLLIATVQVWEVPEQAPPRPVNLRPAAGVAVSVTGAPWVNFAEQTLIAGPARKYVRREKLFPAAPRAGPRPSSLNSPYRLSVE